MDTSKLVGLIITVLLTGFFSGMEAAFASANKLGIELRKKQGIRTGRILADFTENPPRFIGTSLAGTCIVIVVYGILVSDYMHPFWEHALSGSLNSPYLRLFVEVLLATAVILLLGIFIPRAVFRAKSEAMLTFFAIPFLFCYKVLYPVANVFVGISEWILKYLFNVRMSEKKQVFSRADLDHFMKQTQQHNQDNQELNTTLFENALYLVHVKIRECIIPRKEIESLEISGPIALARQKFIDTKLSKIVVFEDNIDNILGYIHQLDMFKNPADIRSVLHPILAVPETMSAVDLMNRFTKEHKSIAWVVDEFGGTAGIVTLEDLLEEIFGEIRDEHDTEEFVEKQIAEKEYIFSGRLEIDYLNKKYDFGLPEGESETLSGFIISHHETIPKLKERIIVDDFEFDILNVTDTRIEMVKMKALK